MTEQGKERDDMMKVQCLEINQQGESTVVQCPKLNQVLAIIGSTIVQQAMQPGGPSSDKTMEMTIDCSDDEVLRSVLEAKGGELGIVIRLLGKPEEYVQYKDRTAVLRKQSGVTALDFTIVGGS